MKNCVKWFLGGVASFLLAVQAVHAQPITGTPFLSNIDPNGANISYANAWSSPAYTFTSTPTGLEVSGPGSSGSFGQLTYNIPANQLTAMNPADTELTFSYTLHSAGGIFGGIQEVLGLTDTNGGTNYYFSGYAVPVLGLNSFSVPLQQPNQGNIASGFTIKSVNLQLDPANLAGSYDLTFNTIALATVPEPATFGLLGIGALGLLKRRRRVA